MPPRKAPSALPELKAAWIQQPPSISPPSECFTIRYCSGEPTPKRLMQVMNINAAAKQADDAKKNVSRRDEEARTK